MPNNTLDYPGKPLILTSKEAQSRIQSGAPYKDVVLPTLYGLNEKLQPDGALTSEFRKIWTEFSENTDNTDFGVYVFYPLRNTIVRYMDQVWNERALLVSNSMLYNNPEGNLSWEEVRKILSDVVVGVAGCSVGKRVAENIVANLRPKFLKIADPKTAHVSNAPRAGWSYEDLGVNKAYAAAAQIHYNLDPFIELFVYPEGIHEQTIDQFISGNEQMDEPRVSLIVEETDDLDYKIWIRETARKNRVPVIMVSDLGSSVQIDIRRFDLQGQASLAVGISDSDLYKKRDVAKENPGNLGFFYDFAFAMLGSHGMRGEFKKIVDKQVPTYFGGVPQLTSTISISGGWMAEVITRIFLGWKFHERMFIDFSQSSLINEGEYL